MRQCPSYLSFILYNPIRKVLTKMFEDMGFEKKIERDGRFTRFAGLRKIK